MINILKKEKGFTLIELLVVIGILALLAGVAIPNIISFMHEGAIESANAEAQNVRVAIHSYIFDTRLDKPLEPVNGTLGSDGSQTGTLNNEIGPYILNGVGTLRAIYSISNGVIIDALPDPNDDFKDLEWSGGHWN